jgi:hypothetical protein
LPTLQSRLAQSWRDWKRSRSTAGGLDCDAGKAAVTLTQEAEATQGEYSVLAGKWPTNTFSLREI